MNKSTLHKTPPKTFDPLFIKIQGTNLIEASAGTGKTWSIAALFLRFILLEKIDVAQILVVTYTKAATGELKSRLRARLAEALAYAKNSNDENSDEFLVNLFSKLTYAKNEQVLRLQAALNHFDKATIYTIHGFCQRVLQEYAFACGSPFEVELVNEDDKALLMLTEDFWRTHVTHNPLWANLVFDHDLTPSSVLNQIKAFLSKPYLHYQIPTSSLEAEKKELANILPELTEQKINSIMAIFWSIHGKLNGNKYRKTSYEKLFHNLLSLSKEYSVQNLLALDSDSLAKLSPKLLESNLKKNQFVTEDELNHFTFFELLTENLQQYKQALENELDILKFKLYEYLNDSLKKHNQQNQQRRFDDLLLDLYEALEHSEQGQALSVAVAKKWQVALIDEFQDTDPIQYDIFNKIFINHNKPLFLVGDPKQAIYKFRGADIFAYLEAAKQANHHYTLGTNFRTHQTLIDQISRLFSSHPRPFLFEEIAYSDVKANRHESNLSPCNHSLNIQWLENVDQPDKAMNKDMARELAAQSCALNIVNQLTQAQNHKLMLNGAPLQAKHIAVLVSTHNQGKLIRDKLKRLNVDSVSLSQESVFSSEEARALLILLNAWLKPNSAKNIVALMASLFFHYSAQQLYLLKQNDAKMLALIQDMQDYQEIWQKKGLLIAYERFNQEHHITEQLLNKAQERSLTNIIQLLELMAEEENQLFSLHAQENWLMEQINLALLGKKADSTQLRLESDENLVKIITIHSSKGLQYPIVYCPFIWDSHRFSIPEMVILHKKNHNYLQTESQLSELDQNTLKNEELAEKLRLLYVAFTRAQEQLNISFGAINNAEQTALAYLLTGDAESKNKNIHLELKNKLKDFAQSDPHISFNLEMQTSQVFTETTTNLPMYKARAFSGRIIYGKSTSSFSALSNFTKQIDDESLPLQLDLTESTPHEEQGDVEVFDRFSLPKGNKIGLCLHSILERFDFQKNANEQLPLIQENLLAYYFDPLIWQEAIIDIIDSTTRALLDKQLSLSQCLPHQQLSEMAFTFRTKQFNPQKLCEIIKHPLLNSLSSFLPTAKRLDFPTLEGFCNGFIDLVVQEDNGKVYVIDYKSNHLGNQLEDYQSTCLIKSIAEHHYYLQAMLYAIATYRYFKQRKQPIQSIHVRYLFLRGMQKQTDNGIWAWDIDLETLEFLNEI